MSHMKRAALACTLGCLAAYAAGCIPFATMRWSYDGSVGVMLQDAGVVLVDGEIGETTLIAKHPDTSAWWRRKDSPGTVTVQIPSVPDISSGGELLVYAAPEPVENLDEFLQRLPPQQVEMIENDARLAGVIHVAAAAVPDAEPPTTAEALEYLSQNPLAASPTYCHLITRYLRERGAPGINMALPPVPPEHEKAEPFPLACLFLLPVDEVGQGPGRFIAANMLGILHPQLSPDGRFVAYLSPSPEKVKGGPSSGFDLWVSSLKTEPVVTVRLAQYVGYGYTWQRDSRAITCLAYFGAVSEEEPVALGRLRVIQIADAQGTLLAEEEEAGAGYVPTGTAEDLAFAWFSPFGAVAQHHTGRLLFSAMAFVLPTTPSKKPRASVFAFDPVTRTVTDVLPTSVSAKTGGTFTVSPDGKRLLIPIMRRGEAEQFLVYGLGDSAGSTPLEGKALLAGQKPLPAWKGPDHIACWLKGNSGLLRDAGLGEDADEKDVLVEVDLEGNLVRVLLAPQPPKEQAQPPAENPKEKMPKE